MRDNVLALVQMPPPHHGAAAVNLDVVSSKRLNENFQIISLPIQLSTSMQDIGDVQWRKLWVVMRNAMKTAAALWREKPAFVYFTLPPHGGGFYASLALVALPKLFRAPLLYHLHGKGIRAAAEQSSLYRRLFAWMMQGAHVVLLSERLYDDVADFVPRARCFILPNALIAPIVARDAAAQGYNHIVFLSNLVMSKGPVVLLDALARLKARGVVFQASFAGEPWPPITRENFQEAIRARGLAESVRYVGFVSGADKQALLRSAAMLAFPTFYANEAFPLVVLEAMGAGLAVVATPEGAIPDMLRDGENGILVPQNDPERLADALQRLIEDPALCRRMGERGREIVGQEFSHDVFHQRMRDIWVSMIDKQKNKAA